MSTPPRCTPFVFVVAFLASTVLCQLACESSDSDSSDAGPGVDGAAAQVDAAHAAIDASKLDAVVDATAAARCPSDPPGDGAACTEAGHLCVWLRCDAGGETQALCQDDLTYAVTTSACTQTPCGSTGGFCGVDQICFTLAGGALLEECRGNPCGEEAIEDSCACDLCSGQCSVHGRSVSCDTCPAGDLCP